MSSMTEGSFTTLSNKYVRMDVDIPGDSGVYIYIYTPEYIYNIYIYICMHVHLAPMMSGAHPPSVTMMLPIKGCGIGICSTNCL